MIAVIVQTALLFNNWNTHSFCRPNMVALKALLTQLFATIAVYAMSVLALGGTPLPGGVWGLAFAQGLLAALISRLLKASWWWALIHVGFMPAVLAVYQFQIQPLWFLAAFILLLLVYGNSFKTQVPLYLSNRTTAQALLDILPADRAVRFLDMGSGDAGLLTQLASARPDCHFTGIESAWIPYLVGRVRARRLSNCTLVRGDFWQENLASYDYVYAFLSPVPMARLWEKSLQELKPGAFLISNSFAVPGQTVNTLFELKDTRKTRLYCYEIAAMSQH